MATPISSDDFIAQMMREAEILEKREKRKALDTKEKLAPPPKLSAFRQEEPPVDAKSKAAAVESQSSKPLVRPSFIGCKCGSVSRHERRWSGAHRITPSCVSEHTHLYSAG
jgi:hypothetical protein